MTGLTYCLPLAFQCFWIRHWQLIAPYKCYAIAFFTIRIGLVLQIFETKFWETATPTNLWMYKWSLYPNWIGNWDGIFDNAVTPSALLKSVVFISATCSPRLSWKTDTNLTYSMEVSRCTSSNYVTFFGSEVLHINVVWILWLSLYPGLSNCTCDVLAT